MSETLKERVQAVINEMEQDMNRYESLYSLDDHDEGAYKTLDYYLDSLKSLIDEEALQ